MNAQTRNTNRQNGFSLIELIIVVVIIGIIAVIAIPNLLQARRASNEASAVSSISLVYRSQMTYKTTEGMGVFADLPTLYSSNFIDSTLGSAPNTKSGYRLELDILPVIPNAEPRFDLRARPVVHTLTSTISATGSRDFGVTESGGIFETQDNTAVAFDATTRQPTGTAVQIDR